MTQGCRREAAASVSSLENRFLLLLRRVELSFGRPEIPVRTKTPHRPSSSIVHPANVLSRAHTCLFSRVPSLVSFWPCRRSCAKVNSPSPSRSASGRSSRGGTNRSLTCPLANWPGSIARPTTRTGRADFPIGALPQSRSSSLKLKS